MNESTCETSRAIVSVDESVDEQHPTSWTKLQLCAASSSSPIARREPSKSGIPGFYGRLESSVKATLRLGRSILRLVFHHTRIDGIFPPGARASGPLDLTRAG